MCDIFTAWPFAEWRYLKRQAAPEHCFGRFVSDEERIQNLRTCRNYIERQMACIVRTEQWGAGDLKQRELVHFTQPLYTEICTSTDIMLPQSHSQV